MTTEIRVPTLGESVTEATVGQWFKKAGDAVNADEPLVELETDKVTVEVPAPAAGVLEDISVKEGETVEVGALLGAIAEGAAAAAKPAEAPPAAPAEAPAADAGDAGTLSPAVRKMVDENSLDPAQIPATGKGGRLLKEDVQNYLKAQAAAAAPAAAENVVPLVAPAPAATPTAAPRAPVAATDAEREERVRMSKLRQTIARRLKDAQNTAAMLTTFNEVDMTAVMAMRKQYRDIFEKKHGVRLGFMGFFVKACIQALREVPEVNAEIDGTDVIYKNYYHVGIAVGTDRGLVVPVVRDADQMSLPQIEATITDFGKKARDGQLGIEDMQGGTFTITNGGVFGSLNSTPILNAPQSGILGMHKIQERPMVIDGEIQIRPMMYLAMSYDHRVVDGQGAVTFLVRVKECLEDPQRLVLDL